MNLSRPGHCRATAALLAWLAASMLAADAHARPPEAPRRVLVLYWYHKDYPLNVAMEQGFRDALAVARRVDVEYYSENLESNRFPGTNLERTFHDYLRQKYAELPVDVVVASGTGAAEFLLRHRRTLFPDVPLVFIGSLAEGAAAAAGPGVTGIATYRSFRKNLDLALGLHPETKHVFIVSGTLERDQRLEARAREELQVWDRKVTVTYLTDRPLHDLILRMKSLPEDSIVLYAKQQMRYEEGGRVLVPSDILAGIVSSARVPVYGMSRSDLGNGVVGGEVFSLERNGARAAELVLRILRGERAQDIPVEDASTVPMFDWRQFRRWGIPEDRLPAGSIVQFRDASVWDLYKWYILGAALVCALQGVLITTLLMERASRRRAELQSQIQQRELTHLSRIVTIGELVGTLAHELRQPLTAIRLNAQTARRLLTHEPLDHAELRDCLEDIIRSDKSAAEVIQRVRESMRRNDGQWQALDLNDVVSDSVSLSASELAARSVLATTHLTPDLPAVLGDRIELQQVLLNLLLNACDAMSGLPAGKRALTVRTELSPDGSVQVSVTDQGPGVPADHVDRIFDPFFTSKEQGLGLGLAICRSIITAHHGRIWVAANAGATFTFRLPALTAAD
jgi:signal transduction histidine kinase